MSRRDCGARSKWRGLRGEKAKSDEAPLTSEGRVAGKKGPTESASGLKDLPIGWMWPGRGRQHLRELRSMATDPSAPKAPSLHNHTQQQHTGLLKPRTQSQRVRGRSRPALAHRTPPRERHLSESPPRALHPQIPLRATPPSHEQPPGKRSNSIQLHRSIISCQPHS